MITARTRRPTTAQADALLRRYRNHGDRSARNELVLLYAPMVRYIVFKKVRELPSHCDAEDYVTAGMEALIAAADRYDPEKGASFEQFAWTRVHGAVMDEMRRDDWAPRSVRRFSRDLDRATERLSSREGRRPTETDIADVLGVSVDELRTKRHEIAGAEVLSLNVPVSGREQTSMERLETIVDAGMDHDPLKVAAARDAKERFRAAFATLPQRDREVALKLYVANMTLREIGDELGVSESRVCQIHSSLKRRLGQQLAGHESLFEAVG